MGRPHLHVGPLIFRDRRKRAELHMSDGNVILWVQIHLFHSFFINFNPYPADHGKCATFKVLIGIYMPCLHVIAAFFRFGNPLQWRNSAWLFLANFILDNYSRLYLLRLKSKRRIGFGTITHVHTVNEPELAEIGRGLPNHIKRASYDLMLGQHWLRRPVNDSKNQYGHVCVDEGLDFIIARHW